MSRRSAGLELVTVVGCWYCTIVGVGSVAGVVAMAGVVGAAAIEA